jgi:hypothetical protein
MAHTTRLRTLLAKIQLAQANLAELYDEVRELIPENKGARERLASAKRKQEFKAKILVKN